MMRGCSKSGWKSPRFAQPTASWMRARRCSAEVIAAQAGAPAGAELQVAQTLDAMAILYIHKKKFAVAEQHARRAIPILEGLKGAELQLASTSVHLASILDSEGHSLEALPYAERAVEILNLAPNAEPVARAEAQMNLALLYAAIGRTIEADQLSREATALVGARLRTRRHPLFGLDVDGARAGVAKASTERRSPFGGSARSPDCKSERPSGTSRRDSAIQQVLVVENNTRQRHDLTTGDQ